jgi:1,4-dihydroxy-2-naphthoate octaprenyltransferase
MKRAALAIRRLIGSVASAIGLEGAFLLAGTALLAVAAGYAAPWGPWLVVGTACVLAGIALALPPRRT